MFNGNVEATEPHSDPKPEIADPGTFTKDNEVVPTTDADKDGEAQIDLSQPDGHTRYYDRSRCKCR